MPLSSFKLPADDVRLVVFQDTVYKLKFSYDPGDGSSFLPCSRTELNHQVEDVLRAALNLQDFDTLRFKTKHFFADCSMYEWQALRVIEFKKDNVPLKAHPSVIKIIFTPHGLEESANEESISKDRGQGAGVEADEGRLEESSDTHRTQHSTQERERARPVRKENKQQETSQVKESSGRKRKTHKISLQFLQASPKVLLVDMGEKISEPELLQRTIESEHQEAGGDYHTAKPRRSPRLAPTQTDAQGDGYHSKSRSSAATHLRRSQSASPERRHTHKTKGSHKTQLSSSQNSKHAMSTQPKSLSPVRKRPRSSLGGLIESFLDGFL